MQRQVLDPLLASREIAESYRSYLRTSFRPADPSFRSELDQALANSIDLTKGPMLQAAAPYQPGASIAALVDDGVLSPLLRELPDDVLPIDRPLFAHQEAAIRKVRAGRNLIIATGTGSGKTECYLVPIIDALLREKEAGSLAEPGVRALLLYPMNALANDQMGRLRGLLSGFPELTFGRYVGDTPRSEREAIEVFRQRHGFDPPRNELVSREAMQSAPPHILLTNYAMLEYLLLRPADSNFFDGPTGTHWRFLVLDEIHVYDGAKGAELGMLLRRVRDRVVQSERGKLVCIGTSATLGRGREDLPQLISFATAIFDERFEWSETGEQDVIEPSRLPLTVAATHELEPHVFAELHTLWRGGANVDELSASASTDGMASAPHEDVATGLDRLLRGEKHVAMLQQQLEQGAVDLADAAEALFGAAGGRRDLVALVDLCAAAQPRPVDAPLLPARYHFMLRALEGAFACLNPDHIDGVPRLSLARREHCQSCPDGTHVFEIGVCRKCGALYVVGRLDGDKFKSAELHSVSLDYLLIGSLTVEQEDEDEAATEELSSTASSSRSALCVGCGQLHEEFASSCRCGGRTVPVVQALPADGGRDLRMCVSCSGRSNTSIVLRFLTGSDAPVAVVATSLYQQLPPSTDADQRDNIGEGRKLLSFADSRQDAAFFAPYLERTYSRAIQRRLIWQVLSEGDEEHRLDDLVIPVRSAAERALVLDPDDGPTTNRTRVRHWLMREVLAVDRRQSLEGVGLAEITVAVPRKATAPQPLLDLGFTDTEALDLIRVLLDTLRVQAAVWLPDDVDIADPIFAPRNVVTRARAQGSEYGILAWLPGKGMNRRVEFVRKVFARKSISADAHGVLDGLWRWLTAPDGPWAPVLRRGNDPKHGTLWALDPERITLLPASEAHPAYRCDTCRTVWWRSINEVCPSYRCPGTLERITGELDEPDHYRTLYTELQPIGLYVEEHTGQLSTDHAADIQQRFLRGEVNALSCSTTFELGVDVGEVQAVLLRNVPPSAANYVQRAGRAGRRAGSPALVVTFAQRRNHDLWHFRNAHTLVDGVVSPPIVNIDNPHIVRRHVHAIAFAAYERHVVDCGRPEHRSVGDFFLPVDGAVDEFVRWLRSQPDDAWAAIARVVPPGVASELGVDHGRWIDDLVVIDTERGTGQLARAAEEVRRDLSELDTLYEELKASDRLGYANAVGAVRKTIVSRRLIDFLAQRTVLPKYGFPVDVVTLDVTRPGDREANQVELDRDLQLAITDFAPGNRLVANKALWESIGLRTMPGRALLRHKWRVCRTCGRFRSVLAELLPASGWPCPTCGGDEERGAGEFVVPAFGFLGRRCKEKPGEARPPRSGFSEKHFDDYVGAPPTPQAVEAPGGTVIEVRTSKQARIAVINGGARGVLEYCDNCGYVGAPAPRKATKTKPKPHERPSFRGGTCGTYPRYVQLGHQYITDAVELRFEPRILQAEHEASVLAALLAATPRLGIAASDVDGGSAPYSAEPSSGLVLFDAVPGGAGHASYLATRVVPLLWEAYGIVDGCECGEESSCYACLRTYRNQRVHNELRRGDARLVLAELLGLR